MKSLTWILGITAVLLIGAVVFLAIKYKKEKSKNDEAKGVTTPSAPKSTAVATATTPATSTPALAVARYSAQ